MTRIPASWAASIVFPRSTDQLSWRGHRVFTRSESDIRRASRRPRPARWALPTALVRSISLG